MKIYSPEGNFNINWNPAKYKTKGGAAKALYKELCRICKLQGADPKWEVWIKSPIESTAHGYVQNAWHVCWESGPYDWAINVFASADWGHCVTYWGFDLAFYE